VLQNADVILVRHRMSGTAAGVYAGAAVAARGVLWFGVGLGLFLLPEAARRARAGGDPRAVLAQMIGLVCVLAIPLTAIYAAFGQQLLRVLFHVHHHLPAAAGALPLLSLAMALLAISYLVIQYLLALRRRSFAIPLVLAVALESTGVLLAGASFAGVTLAIVVVQALLLGALLTTALSESVPALAAEEVVVA
jgi:O-antigen/teichoic acid export membrane protein